MEEKREITHLHIAEKFFSIQGEGRNVGQPSIFIRLTGCNLLCSTEHKGGTWTCDTIDVWRKGTKQSFHQIIHDEKIIHGLTVGARVIFTGGEPLLHQDSIYEFVMQLRREGFHNQISVETNGTVMPSKKMLSIVDQWNCSPKLANSGEPENKRINQGALQEIMTTDYDFDFKFVISDASDLAEIQAQYMPIFQDWDEDFDNSCVTLMPATDKRDHEHHRMYQIVAEFCIQFGYRFSPRLQVDIWNQTTGL